MLTDEQMTERHASQDWTAHNIRINEAVTTLPGQPDLLETDYTPRALLRMLSTLYRGRLAGVMLADSPVNRTNRHQSLVFINNRRTH
jgi:hypothetical protein